MVALENDREFGVDVNRWLSRTAYRLASACEIDVAITLRVAINTTANTESSLCKTF